MGAHACRNAATAALEVLAVLVSAGAFAACFAPYHLHGLAWFALVPFLVAIRLGTPKAAVTLAGLWGMAAAYGVTDWLPPTIALYYQQPLWLGVTIFAGAAALMGAVEYMAFAAFYHWSAGRAERSAYRAAVVLPAAAAWVAAELARARLFTGNPWGLLGYTQVTLVTAPPAGLAAPSRILAGLPQVADLTGVYGIGFVLVAVNLGLAEVVVAASRRRPLGGPVLELGVVGALLACALGYGHLLAPRHPATAGPAVRVSVAQGNLDLGSRWDPRFYGRNLASYLELTRKELSRSRARVMFWPENAMTFFVDDEPAYRRAIAAVTEPAGAELVAGAPRFVHRHDPVYYNSAFLLSPRGEVLAHYDKEHLLPFSEYMPLAGLDAVRRSFGRVRSFEPGNEATLLPTRAGKAGVVICNEAMFPRLVRARVLAGAQVLVNLSNDAWIRDGEFAEHQFDTVALRAIEQRRYLVRASTSGPSAVIAPSGLVLARTEPFSASTVSAAVAPVDRITVYARWGDGFALACAVIVALRLAWSLRSPPRGRAR